MHEVLVNRLVKLAQEKSVVRITDRLNMTIAVDWDVMSQTKKKLMSNYELNTNLLAQMHYLD